LEFDTTPMVDMPASREPEDDIENSCQIPTINLDIEEITLNL